MGICDILECQMTSMSGGAKGFPFSFLITMADRLTEKRIDRRTESEKQMSKGVVVKFVGSEEHVVCETGKNSRST
jgi:hypothetical protein